MNNFNFETNLEKRMPNGQVYFVDRMTSDYANAHPFDVDAFLEGVFQKWNTCETAAFRETREAIRSTWESTLSQTFGNAGLYPNKDGARRPALVEVWLMAGDYWRRGFRLGDVLPAVLPACRITRLNNGEWVALFPKDLHLLHEGNDATTSPTPQPEIIFTPNLEDDCTPESEPVPAAIHAESTLRTVFVEILIGIVCTLVFFFSMCNASIIGAGIAIGMLATASRMGYTPIMTAATLQG